MNIQALMKQAQNMQKEMMKVKEEIDRTMFEGTNTFVRVTIDGTKKVHKVQIDKNVDLTTDDIEPLEDMIMLAINEAMKKVDEMTEQKMGKFSNVPGLF